MKLMTTPGEKPNLAAMKWAKTGKRAEEARLRAAGLLNSLLAAASALNDLSEDTGLSVAVEIDCEFEGQTVTRYGPTAQPPPKKDDEPPAVSAKLTP